MPQLFTYAATVVKVVDGDTVDMIVDLGFRVSRKDRFRLYGLNAPERNTPEGPLATAFLRSLLPEGKQVMIRSHHPTSVPRTDPYGRYIVEIMDGEININDLIVEKGFAVPFMRAAT